MSLLGLHSRREGLRRRAMLNPAAVKRFYDRFGARQDRQSFYEDRALDELIAHADFGAARHIVEFGCGTGRLAQYLLARNSTARYTGCDVSTTMVGLAADRLATFGERVQVRLQALGSVELPVDTGAADRIVSTYVLDLLPESAIHAFQREARRALAPGGRVCLVGITSGSTPLSSVVMAVWKGLWRVAPAIVGGCRPIGLATLWHESGWNLTHVARVVRWGIASEVVIATLPQ